MKDSYLLVLKESHKITPNVLHMTFIDEKEQPRSFIPGQFITFHFEHNGETLRRSYSIATRPDQNPQLIEIAVGYFPEGPATELLFNLKPGASLHTTGPFGRLTLREEKIDRYILVATGTGVSPYRAMIPEIKQRILNENLRVDVLLGVQSREHLLYGKDFLELASTCPGFNFHACYSRGIALDLAPHEKLGYVQQQFDALNLNPAADVVYVCGNPAMVDDAFSLLKEQGFDIKQIRREKYVSS